MNDTFVRISTAEAVVNYVKAKIEAGELKPGDRLPSERKLQQELEISRFALREGLARLNALGIISSSQGKASVVNADVNSASLNDVFLPLGAGDNPDYIDDLFFSRCLIESECAALAAVNRTAVQLARLQDLLNALKASIEDESAYARIDYELHHAIVDAGGNVFLIKIHELLQQQLQPVIARSVHDREHRDNSMRWHRKIVKAIEVRDAEQAKKAMTGHLGACQSAYKG